MRCYIILCQPPFNFFTKIQFRRILGEIEKEAVRKDNAADADADDDDDDDEEEEEEEEGDGESLSLSFLS